MQAVPIDLPPVVVGVVVVAVVGPVACDTDSAGSTTAHTNLGDCVGRARQGAPCWPRLVSIDPHPDGAR